MDVPPDDPFYSYIRCLVCRQILSGYTTSPPCARWRALLHGGATSRAARWPRSSPTRRAISDAIPSTQQTFTDVPYGSPFWLYVERASAAWRDQRLHAPARPAPTGVPCFLPGNTVTRGQMAKIDTNAGGLQRRDPLDAADVHRCAATATRSGSTSSGPCLHGVISGYSTSPPCPGGVPCFLPGNTVTRGQTAKIVANTFYPGCTVPARSPTGRDESSASSAAAARRRP